MPESEPVLIYQDAAGVLHHSAAEARLADCLEQPAIVREMYELAIEALESKRKAQLLWFRDSPDTLLAKSVRMLELLTDVLKRLRLPPAAVVGGPRQPANPPTREREPAVVAGLRAPERPPIDPPIQSR